jgi:hypothetical protein
VLAHAQIIRETDGRLCSISLTVLGYESSDLLLQEIRLLTDYSQVRVGYEPKA